MASTGDDAAGTTPGRPSFAGTGRFEVLGELGVGGMGVVYRVRDRSTGEVRALKTVPEIHPELLLRLKDEFRAAVDLRHVNLVRLGELVEDAGAWFFTMELVDGVSFTEWVRGPRPPATGSDPNAATMPDLRGTPGPTRELATAVAVPGEPVRAAPGPSPRGAAGFDEARLRAVLAQLATAVHALHQADRVHRDIKPSNVLVTATGRVVVLDFGLTTTLGRRGEELIAGTVEYMAPEQALGAASGPAADWYAVGVLLHECLTGVVPFDGEPMAILHAKASSPPPRPSERADGVPPDLDALCVSLLDPDPRCRLGGESLLTRLTSAAAADGRASSARARVGFVGRRRELSLVADALDRSRDGAVILLLEGVSGIGKSSIARQAAVDAELADAAVVTLTGRCHDRESLPFRAFDGVVDDLSRVLKQLSATEVDAMLPSRPQALARLFPVLARVATVARAGDPGPTATPRELRGRGFEQLRDLLAALAGRGPLIVLVDDLQWMDDDSVDLLVHLLAEPASPRLLLLGTMRPGAEALADRLAARGVAPPIIVRVGALDDDDARALARTALEVARRDGPGHPLVIDTVVADAGGHPGYIRELARTPQPADGGSPLALEALLVARVASLPAAQQRLLEALCIATGPLELDLLAAGAGLDSGAAGPHVAALRDQELVSVKSGRTAELVEPYHDRVRTAVHASLPSDERRRAHKRLAIALEAHRGASLEDLCHHWLEAGRRSHAAGYASRAADAAASRLQFHRAAELYQAAIELGEPLKPSTRATLQIRLGNSLALAGRSAEAADHLLAASGAVAPDLGAALRRTAAEQLMASGHYSRGMDTLRVVLREAGFGYPTGRFAMLAAFLGARARLRLRGMEPRSTPAAVEPRVILGIEAALAASRSLGLVDLVRGSYYQARFLRLALDAADPAYLAVGYALEACYVAASGGAHEAQAVALAERAAAAAAQDGSAERAAPVQLAHAIIAFMAGRFADAVEAADETERIAASTPGAAWDLRTARIVAAWSCWFSGQLTQLAIRVRSHLRDADASSDRYSSMQLRLGVNNGAWLVVDDVAGALRAVDEARAGWPAEDIQNLQYYGCIAQVNALLYAGDDRAAAATVAEAWPLVARSLMFRVPFSAVAMRELRARAALGVAAAEPSSRARARLLAAARRDAAGIRRQAEAWCEGSAALIEAGAAFVEGDHAAARRSLQAVVVAPGTFALVVHVAHLALGRLGDEAVAAAARATLIAEGVVQPDRLARLFCPPFFTAA